jgi:hypothetical protein
MTLFLRLSNRIININTIRTVWHDPVKHVYDIHFITQGQNGIWFLGSGGFSTEDYQVSYNKNKHPDDFATIDKWYNSIGKQ